jgi:two-component system nitrogen regulation response regulator NtrX
MAHESILVVDDEPGVRSMLEAILKDEGYGVASVGTGEDGVAAATGAPFDAMLLDVWLPGIDGLETLSQLKAKGVDTEVVMISGHGTIDTAVKATKLGAFDFVEKPLSLEKTLLVLRNALRQRRLEKRNRALLDQLSRDTEILGDSPGARRVRREAEAASATDAPVLICGEAGSGRETIARHIHGTSRRADQAFVHVPCGGWPEGALARLSTAARGSLFLDEVDLLPRSAQEALAAALPAHPDVRVIASASAEPAGLTSPLREMIDVVRIATVPLRDRREDIEPLAVRFLSDLAREYGRPSKTLSGDAVAALRRSDWPGNVRALRNIAERLVLLSPSREIALRDLPAELGGADEPAVDLYAAFPTLAQGLEVFARYFLARALREEKGDVEAAARRVGVTPVELRARLG